MNTPGTVNPKTLMGRTKVPMLSVIPPVVLAHLGHAMRYGAYEARQKDGKLGYGPFNWRDINIEYSTYLDAAARHLAAFWDGDDPFVAEQLDIPDGAAEDSRVHHLAHAMATIGILLDAIEHGTALDDRPKVRKGIFTRVCDRLKGVHAVHLDEPKVPTAADLEALAASIPAQHAARDCPGEPVQTMDPIGGVPLDRAIHAADCPGGCEGTGVLLWAEDDTADGEHADPCPGEAEKAGGTD